MTIRQRKNQSNEGEGSSNGKSGNNSASGHNSSSKKGSSPSDNTRPQQLAPSEETETLFRSRTPASWTTLFLIIGLVLAIVYNSPVYSEREKRFALWPQYEAKAKQSICEEKEEKSGYYSITGTSGIAPIHAVLMPDGKVMTIGRTNAGGHPDYWTNRQWMLLTSVYDPITHKVRTLNVPSDVFCSNGAIMADGRLLSLGGSQHGFRGVRLFRPKSKPGQFSDAIWHEKDKDNRWLRTSTKRWYPATVIMPDGRIWLIQGNDGGSYAFVRNTLEIFPQPEGCPSESFKCLTPVDWLQEIQDRIHPKRDFNNLYVFPVVLPDGNLYMLAHKYSAILNGQTGKEGQLIKELPILLDKLDDFPLPRVLTEFMEDSAPSRSYNGSASMSLMPLDPAKNYEAKIFVCGGSYYEWEAEKGKNSPTLRSCGMITPLAQNPQWTYVDPMPYPRTMPEMVLLPDETVLIVNGAAKGCAGYNNVKDPTMEALIYDPKRPVGQRWRASGTSTIPRVYHSMALLLPDASVWIGGSVPNSQWRFLDRFDYPNEHRVEIYTPPYLVDLPNWRRPQIGNIDSEEFQNYNREFWVDVTIPSTKRDSIRVNIVHGGFKTHAVPVQQRLVILEVLQIGARTDWHDWWDPTKLRIKLKTPPNANIAHPGWYMLFLVDDGIPSVATWVQVGGDPANTAGWLPEIATMDKP